MNALIGLAVIFLGFVAVLVLLPLSVVHLTRERKWVVEQISGQSIKGRLYMGSYPILPLNTSVYMGGTLAYASGQAARVVEQGSILFFGALIGLAFSLIVLFSRVLVRKSVTACALPVPTLLTTYALVSFPILTKRIAINQPAWVRARIDETKDMLVEVGTRDYETTDVVRIAHPFSKEAAIEESVRRVAALAGLWKLESKGYVELT
jgi:hypothetical protein